MGFLRLFSVMAIITSLLALAGCGGGSLVPNNISTQVEQWRSQAGTPALAVAVVNSDRILRSGVAGLTEADGTTKVAADNLWFIGSSSKTMTATLAGVLVEQGKISWNTTVGETLTELPDTLSAYKNVTLEQLLSHRSGLPGYDTAEEAAQVPTDFPGDLRQQRLGLANWALQQQPVNEPGTAVVYSNIGYFVAAVMLERASGQLWEQALQERVLRPLNLSVKFALPGAGRTGQPWGHAWEGDHWVKVNPDDPASQIPEVVNPIGNVSMDLASYANWARINLAGLRGIGNAALKASTIQKLHTIVGESDGGNGQALAWYRNNLDGDIISAALGSDNTFYGLILIDSKRDRAAVVIANGTKAELEDDPVLTSITDLAKQQLKF
jgi:CubicO group peptidase (beta-lactamase class C family)